MKSQIQYQRVLNETVISEIIMSSGSSGRKKLINLDVFLNCMQILEWSVNEGNNQRHETIINEINFNMCFLKIDLLRDLWKGIFFDKETHFQAKRIVADVSLYFGKGFDTIVQRKFLVKLEKIGISRGTECWTKGWLKEDSDWRR